MIYVIIYLTIGLLYSWLYMWHKYHKYMTEYEKNKLSLESILALLLWAPMICVATAGIVLFLPIAMVLTINDYVMDRIIELKNRK